MTYINRKDFTNLAMSQATFWNCGLKDSIRAIKRLGIHPRKK